MRGTSLPKKKTQYICFNGKGSSGGAIFLLPRVKGGDDTDILPKNIPPTTTPNNVDTTNNHSK